MIARVTDIENSEITNTEPDWAEGFGLIDLDEIEMVSGGDEDCTVYFKSGATTGVKLLLDDFATILDSK